MKYNKLTCFSLSLLGLAAFSVYAESWDSKFYNPKILDEDVILPMPCEGAMVFRVIKTNTQKPLEDKAIVLGNEGSEQKFAEYTTPNYIAGAFSNPQKERYFLMAKYEVSQLQYQAVMGNSCPQPNNKLRLPQTDISWFDAVQFSHQYSQWLLANAKDKLPKEGDALGYVRLPTGAEWEYAVRGGAAVTESEFRDRIFPVPDGLNKVAWSSKNANGRLQLTGQLSPNPLGLFDMLGNVNEMVFDAFRANKLDRYHGLSGGITVRGGSYLTSEDQLSSAFRAEQPYYTNIGEPFKAKDTGFRVMLSSPLLVSSQRLKEINEEWENLGQDSEKDQDIVGNLQKIGAKVEDKVLKEQLQKVQDELRAANQEKEQQRNNAIHAALRLGAFLCTNLKDLQYNYDYSSNRKNILCGKEGEMDKNCPRYIADMEADMKALEDIKAYYADTIVNTAINYTQSIVSQQVDPVISKIKSQYNSSAAVFDQYVTLFWKHLDGYYQNGKHQRNDWTEACSSYTPVQSK